MSIACISLNERELFVYFEGETRRGITKAKEESQGKGQKETTHGSKKQMVPTNAGP